MIPNAAKTRSSHDNQGFSVDGKAARRKVKLCYRKWLGVVLLLQWSRIFVLDYPGAYRTVTLLVSTHASVCRETPGVPCITVQYRADLWVKLGILRCGLFQMCCAMLRIIKWRITTRQQLRVSSTLGRAVHFRVNTDAGDWEHPGPECGSVGKQSLGEQN